MIAQVERRNWFRAALQLKGSVWPVILPRVVFFGGFGVLVSLIDSLALSVDFTLLGELTTNVACNLVLGLLLVFRTNTAYDRYWEGRKAWGTLVVNLRNLAREIQLNVNVSDPVVQAQKTEAMKLLSGFAIATKQHLRQAPMPPEFDGLLADATQVPLSQSNHPPLEITLRIGRFLQQLYQQNLLDVNQRVSLSYLLNNLVEGLTSCERILKTPIPPAYMTYLKWLLLIYCTLLPFNLVGKLHFWTGLGVAAISTVLLGVEEIGSEIEDPFGTDPNDLPLDALCVTVTDNIDHTLAVLPTSEK